MITRARIAIPMRDGRFKSIYTHWDGAPDTMGKTLVDHYHSKKLASAVLDLGSISELHARLAPAKGERHSFNKPLPGVTLAYGRDRGDKDCASTCSATVADLVAAADDSGGEFVYVFSDGRWLYSPIPWPGTGQPSEIGLREVQP